MTKAARAAVSPMPARFGNSTSNFLVTSLFKSLARVRLIFSFWAQASWANGVSMLMAITSAFNEEKFVSPWLMSHNSVVHTLVNAAGKKRRTVFFLPKLLLSFTSTRPEACLDLREKSGALVPTGIGINNYGLILLTGSLVERVYL